MSFYPYSQSDEAWPGSIQSADAIEGFPVELLSQATAAAWAWVIHLEPLRAQE